MQGRVLWERLVLPIDSVFRKHTLHTYNVNVVRSIYMYSGCRVCSCYLLCVLVQVHIYKYAHESVCIACVHVNACTCMLLTPAPKLVYYNVLCVPIKCIRVCVRLSVTESRWIRFVP